MGTGRVSYSCLARVKRKHQALQRWCERASICITGGPVDGSVRISQARGDGRLHGRVLCCAGGDAVDAGGARCPAHIQDALRENLASDQRASARATAWGTLGVPVDLKQSTTVQ